MSNKPSQVTFVLIFRLKCMNFSSFLYLFFVLRHLFFYVIKPVHYKAYVHEMSSVLIAFPFTEAHVSPEHPRQSCWCSVNIPLGFTKINLGALRAHSF
jgi:hypothetical protein